MTTSQIMSMIPAEKRIAIHDAWVDNNGIWIMLNEGWNADNTVGRCRIIHCGGSGEPWAAVMQDLKKQIAGINRKEAK